MYVVPAFAGMTIRRLQHGASWRRNPVVGTAAWLSFSGRRESTFFSRRADGWAYTCAIDFRCR